MLKGVVRYCKVYYKQVFEGVIKRHLKSVTKWCLRGLDMVKQALRVCY